MLSEGVTWQMPVRHRLWLTYDWDDNEGKDVDFVVSELEAAGLTVLLDRTKLKAGLRLWDQIGAHITDPETHGWCIFATQNSLGNEKCMEELSYALDRALNDRGRDFPIIAILPVDVSEELIPEPVKVRLNVFLTDEHWTERVVAAVEGRIPVVALHRGAVLLQSSHFCCGVASICP
jgi:hypothetical protein